MADESKQQHKNQSYDDCCEASRDRIANLREGLLRRIGFSPRHVIQHRMERFCPRVNLYDADEHYLIVAELPGMASEDISVSVEHNAITIRGQRAHRDETGKALFLELLEGRFKRVVSLKHEVDAGASKAHLGNGILTVVAPRSGKPDTVSGVEIDIKTTG